MLKLWRYPPQKIQSRHLKTRELPLTARKTVFSHLKSNITINVMKFWLHLIGLPDTSIAKQCILLSNQLANNGKSSFMLSFHEL